jgi:hypothetical protein
VTLVILTLVLASAAVYEATFVEPTRVSTTISTIEVPSSLADKVSIAYGNHLLQFGSKNVSALVSQYEDNATIVYFGQSAGLAGRYSGTANITQLLATWISKNGEKFFFIANESQPTMHIVTMGSQNSTIAVTVNSTLGFRGDSGLNGNFNGTISAETTFVRGGANDSSWLISLETWNFLRFWVQYPVIA